MVGKDGLKDEGREKKSRIQIFSLTVLSNQTNICKEKYTLGKLINDKANVITNCFLCGLSSG